MIGYTQAHTWRDEPGGVVRSAKLFQRLPHRRCCECDRCMEIRDNNQYARDAMGWRQPPYRMKGDTEE